MATRGASAHGETTTRTGAATTGAIGATSSHTATSGMPHVDVGSTSGRVASPQLVRPLDSRTAAGGSFHSTRICASPLPVLAAVLAGAPEPDPARTVAVAAASLPARAIARASSTAVRPPHAAASSSSGSTLIATARPRSRRRRHPRTDR